MVTFDYHRPASLHDAAELLKRLDEPVLLAGGQTLIPTLKQRLAHPSDVVDLAGIGGLREVGAANGIVAVGAMARHADVAGSELVRKQLPALAALAAGIGDPQVRNRGTVGGSVANSDPAADYPAAVVALGATVHTHRRALAGDTYFRGMFETALEAGEIIVRVDFPVPDRAAYCKFPSPASRYATVGVFVAVFGKQVRVSVTGAGPCAFRAKAFEDALVVDLRPAALDGIDVPAGEFNSDLHASADFRAHLVTVMAKRAVAALPATSMRR